MKKGFTIIETMLVLSISGLLTVGLMVGWSTNLNRQRYEDSVNTFKSDIQQVFNAVENPTNERVNNVNCVDSGDNISLSQNGQGKARGTTNCVILGKMIVLGDSDVAAGSWSQIGQSFMTVRDVIGLDIDVSTACRGVCNSHIDALRATKFVVSDGKNNVGGLRRIDLEWDSQFKNVTDNRTESGQPFKGDSGVNGFTANLGIFSTVPIIMILRSPVDGSILTFGVPLSDDSGGIYTDDKKIADFRNWSTSTGFMMSSQKTVNLCVRAGGNGRFIGGLSGYGRNKVIKIGSNSSSVEIAPLDGENGSSCGRGAGYGDVIINGRALRG